MFLPEPIYDDDDSLMLVKDVVVGVLAVLWLVGIEDERENCGNIVVAVFDLTGAEPGAVGVEEESDDEVEPCKYSFLIWFARFVIESATNLLRDDDIELLADVGIVDDKNGE